jgi:hypothetical protein
MVHVSNIKLIRKDITLYLSQKVEKGMTQKQHDPLFYSMQHYNVGRSSSFN